jgi:hypothetical protein
MRTCAARSIAARPAEKALSGSKAAARWLQAKQAIASNAQLAADHAEDDAAGADDADAAADAGDSMPPPPLPPAAKKERTKAAKAATAVPVRDIDDGRDFTFEMKIKYRDAEEDVQTKLFRYTSHRGAHGLPTDARWSLETLRAIFAHYTPLSMEIFMEMEGGELKPANVKKSYGMVKDVLLGPFREVSDARRRWIVIPTLRFVDDIARHHPNGAPTSQLLTRLIVTHLRDARILFFSITRGGYQTESGRGELEHSLVAVNRGGEIRNPWPPLDVVVYENDTERHEAYVAGKHVMSQYDRGMMDFTYITALLV